MRHRRETPSARVSRIHPEISSLRKQEGTSSVATIRSWDFTPQVHEGQMHMMSFRKLRDSNLDNERPPELGHFKEHDLGSIHYNNNLPLKVGCNFTTSKRNSFKKQVTIAALSMVIVLHTGVCVTALNFTKMEKLASSAPGSHGFRRLLIDFLKLCDEITSVTHRSAGAMAEQTPGCALLRGTHF
ncbi:unnamed protein product [Mesocestoides corti]|uniref:Uncharacterized protein n=1 Tax=Mesocestoides corti TaxID=53468 RepID=A0A0R3UEE9_MESCO|nr:unnamed protein product [Mesocestoides corti]